MGVNCLSRSQAGARTTEGAKETGTRDVETGTLDVETGTLVVRAKKRMNAQRGDWRPGSTSYEEDEAAMDVCEEERRIFSVVSSSFFSLVNSGHEQCWVGVNCLSRSQAGRSEDYGRSEGEEPGTWRLERW